MPRVRIGGGQGFWGDSPDAAIHMVKTGSLDYMACDYLAELTMSILARQRIKDPTLGYARDFVSLYNACCEDARNNGTTIIANAGGMNVEGCVDAVADIARKHHLKDTKVGYVSGDDMAGIIDRMHAEGVPFENMDGVGDFSDIKDRICNANVYFGHEPILRLVDEGADVIVTGRSTDSALFLAPIMHDMGWTSDDWNNLACGIMAGHLLECGGQGAGGNFEYDWKGVPLLDELGYPIAEISDDGLIITKAPDCGGIISVESVEEQLLYEVLDPGNYITPDVTVDISNATVEQIGNNRVLVGNIKGKKRTDMLKLSIGYYDGYRVQCMLSFAWPDAYEKANYTADLIMKRVKRKGFVPEEIQIDFIGLNSLHLGVANMGREHLENLNECVMRIAVHTKTKEMAQILVPEIAPMQLNGAPGASFFGGRSHITPVIGLWPTLIPRDMVKLTTYMITI